MVAKERCWAYTIRHRTLFSSLQYKDDDSARTYIAVVNERAIDCAAMAIREIGISRENQDGLSDYSNIRQETAFHLLADSSARAVFVSTCRALTAPKTTPTEVAKPKWLSTAAQNRIAEQGLSISQIVGLSSNLRRGFDFLPAGRDGARNPADYLGAHLRQWLRRNQSLDRDPQCERAGSRRIRCSYTLRHLPDALGTDVLNGPVAVSVVFLDSLAVQVTAVYAKGLMASDGQADLDENSQTLLTLLYGTPRTALDLTTRSTLWRTPLSDVTRGVRTGSEITRWRWSVKRP